MDNKFRLQIKHTPSNIKWESSDLSHWYKRKPIAKSLTLHVSQKSNPTRISIETRRAFPLMHIHRSRPILKLLASPQYLSPQVLKAPKTRPQSDRTYLFVFRSANWRRRHLNVRNSTLRTGSRTGQKMAISGWYVFWFNQCYDWIWDRRSTRDITWRWWPNIECVCYFQIAFSLLRDLTKERSIAAGFSLENMGGLYLFVFITGFILSEHRNSLTRSQLQFLFFIWV